MYAVFIEVNADDSKVTEARKSLNEQRVPKMKEAGATKGLWLAPQGGRGISIVVFDSEADARKAAANMKVGEPVGDIAGVTFKTVEVREVIAAL